MSKGTRQGKRGGRSKGGMGSHKHHFCSFGKSPANRTNLMLVHRDILRERDRVSQMKKRKLSPMFETMAEMWQYCKEHLIF